MGLNVNSLKFLLLARERGVSFRRVLMIGRQSIGVSPRDIRTLASLPLADELADGLRRLDIRAGQYAEPFFALCGAEQIDSMDRTAYEGATILHDLNVPIPHTLAGRYDLIVDGGSIEHVFNVPVALASYIRMLAVGGHYVCNTATNNYSGHGFYQLSAELFFAAFAPENGCTVRDAVLYEENGANVWYRLTPPDHAARRMTFQNCIPAHLLVLTRKDRQVEPFASAPQQRMYDAAWNTAGAAEALAVGTRREQLLGRLAAASPWLMWRVLNTWNRLRRFRPDMFTRADEPTRGRG
jgi:hypothetical protein